MFSLHHPDSLRPEEYSRGSEDGCALCRGGLLSGSHTGTSHAIQVPSHSPGHPNVTCTELYCTNTHFHSSGLWLPPGPCLEGPSYIPEQQTPTPPSKPSSNVLLHKPFPHNPRRADDSSGSPRDLGHTGFWYFTRLQSFAPFSISPALARFKPLILSQRQEQSGRLIYPLLQATRCFTTSQIPALR